MKKLGTTLPPQRKKNNDWSNPVPTLTVMTHANPARMGERALLNCLASGGKVELSRASPVFTPVDKVLGQPLDDPFLSRKPIIFRSDGNGGVFLDPGEGKIKITTDISAEKLGWRFNAESITRGVVLTLSDRVVLLLHWTHFRKQPKSFDHGMIGCSDSMLFLRQEIDRIADLDTPVLLMGASGTGKELAAQAIHKAGKPGRPFVSVNLGALPTSLAASELFGAVKGSFTGADRNQLGYFRAAHGGTLFLDEVGEASSEVQVMLLRAIETGEISPIGAQTPLKIETRLIAATDSDLEQKMAENSFKTPLFHRLAGYAISLPPLSQRLEDLPRLFLHFAKQELARLGDFGNLKPRTAQEDLWVPPELMVRFLRFSWPGNIRQLRNAVRQTTIGCRGEPVLHSVPKLEQMFNTDPSSSPALAPEEPVVKRKPAKVPYEEMVEALRQNRWDIKAAAKQLGISRTALYLLIEKAPNLRTAADVSAEDLHQGLERHGGDVGNLGDELGISPRALRRRLSKLNLAPKKGD